MDSDAPHRVVHLRGALSPVMLRGDMAYDWTPDVAVGIDEIDAQHRELLARIAELHRCMRGGETDSVPAVLAGVRKYARTHFDTEEDHMRRLAYPDMERHVEQHHRFTAELDAFEEDLRQRGTTPSLAIHLAAWLSAWFRDHIRGYDQQLGAFARGSRDARL